MPTIKALARWIDANGCRSFGYDRELYSELGEDGGRGWRNFRNP
jgi:hypothetical protein